MIFLLGLHGDSKNSLNEDCFAKAMVYWYFL